MRPGLVPTTVSVVVVLSGLLAWMLTNVAPAPTGEHSSDLGTPKQVSGPHPLPAPHSASFGTGTGATSRSASVPGSPLPSARSVGSTALAHMALAASTAPARPGDVVSATDVRSVRRTEALRRAGVLRLSSAPIEVHGITHQAERFHKRGLPVLNRSVRVHARDGRPFAVTGRTTIPPLARGPRIVTREQAVESAKAAVGGRGLRAAPRVVEGWHATDDRTLPVWQVTLPVAQPLGTWRIVVDARNARIVAKDDLMLHATGTGFVYPENVATTPAPAALPLFELDGAGFLRGRITQVFDVRDSEAYRPDLTFSYATTDPRFAQTSVYRGLTDAARFAETSGLPPLTERVLAFVNLYGGSAGQQYNNAFYDPFFPIFGFGNGDGSLLANLATDSDVAIHEMGHHVFATLVDPSGSSTLRAVAAINEGFADALAALVNDDPEIGESTRPGQPYLRTVANPATWPADTSLDPHLEGLIFGGLVWDLRVALGRDHASDIVLAGLPFLDPDADFPAHEFREALVAGEQLVSGGAARTTVENVALARGIESLSALGIAGYLSEGQPASGSLASGEFELYLFSEFPGSRQLTFQMTGTGDADLLVAPAATFDPNDPTTYFFPALSSSLETVVVSTSTMPSVDADDLWLVGVEDYAPDGVPSSYQISVSSLLPQPVIVTGGSYTGWIPEAGDFQLLTFQGFAGQIVRLDAIALSQGLDLAVSILDPITLEFFGSDDDSGDGTDALIQGARLPRTQLYAIAVFSLIDDVDPTATGGAFQLDLSLCSNTGTDTDGDGLADVCDDDDDDDGFVDASDIDPLDPLRCDDVEGDGCDDCTNGDFLPFDDGPNADGDHLCDAGDPDDDNDGCMDVVDPAPLTPSVDDDVDGVGLDCDNCPDDYNPGQVDTDADGLGDPCDPTPVPEPTPGWLALSALLTVGVLATLLRHSGRPASRRPSPDSGGQRRLQ